VDEKQQNFVELAEEEGEKLVLVTSEYSQQRGQNVKSENDGEVFQRALEEGKSSGLRTSCSLQGLQKILCKNGVER